MTAEKQIEEMAKILCGQTSGCENCMFNYNTCFERKDAEEIYNAGYRKASDVAEEIFAEIHENIKAEKFHHKNFGDLVYLADIDRILAELKKKYTESEGGE